MKNLKPLIASLVLAATLPVYAEMESAPAALGEAVLVEKTATVEGCSGCAPAAKIWGSDSVARTKVAEPTGGSVPATA